ncbi:hypothetical protein E7Z59_07750 [Robertkochia marina]|uniref:Uncharacterized protein n=1 Tax=Robertkochia marina TaxID=1227945 RepID=A0A4S3M0J4_9FLAO|nr:hypothetical protein [Robertkochia marina]THD67547.1 hypothetical protein E7Z59_07750 [Robertkochia marina]TRZ44585.1 hypothetical protein D3A96_08195 [Robertkochia marina]
MTGLLYKTLKNLVIVKRFRLFIALILFVTGISCKDSDDSEVSCDNVVCTEDFRTMTITITYDNGDPVALDDFSVIISESGQDITGSYSDGELEWYRNNGIYPVIDDSYSDEFRNTTVFLKFSGSVNGEIVVQRSIVAGADCCHVYLKDDNLTINIPRG